MLRNRLGFTLVEAIVVMLILAVVASIAVPRALNPSPQRQVDLAARALTRDLELLRMRTISAKRRVRVRVNVSQGFYTAFMDTTATRLGTISETAAEVRQSSLLTRGGHEGVPGVNLPKKVEFGTGVASSGPPGYGATGPVLLVNGDYVEFDSHGMVDPAGTGGIIYLTHEDDPTAVAAVTITGASAFRSWRYRGGSWVR
jgi:prepilin-type N-terminal cleavage/methylation domain-containing protein